MEATLQGIFQGYFTQYKERNGLSIDQYRAAQAILACQTDDLGYEEWACAEDNHTERQAHSCRNRSCPRCQGALSEAWMEKTQARLLSCDHYHVVFTLPHEFNEVWQYNRKWSASHLLKASAETVQQLLRDERYLGAEVGILASLHTWGRTHSFHPHAHLLVTGGGWSKGEWQEVKKDFLLPVKVLKAKFRGKWLSWLNTAYAAGELQLPGHWRESDWKRTLVRIARKSWNVRIQGPYRHGNGVVNYLSRYVRGGPIKDRQIERADEQEVTFRYRDHHDGKAKRMTLKTEHFMSRILWHVPVKGQHNVRYYGLYVPGAHGKRDQMRAQLGQRPGEVVETRPKEERKCPHCGRILRHRSSTRRKISTIRSGGPRLDLGVLPNKPFELTGTGFVQAAQEYSGFFCAERRQLN